MRLTEVQSLTAGYSSHDINEVVEVMTSTLPTTPSSVVRWSNVSSKDTQQWFRQKATEGFKQEFQLPRIASLLGENKVPSARYAEHLVVRDLDMEHLDEGDGSLPPGRIVAHADYRFVPNYGRLSEGSGEQEATNTSTKTTTTTYPPGFNQELNSLLNGKIESGLYSNFGGLPCFELRGISTLTPSHLRKGIAKRLVEWVFPYAEQFALPVVLAASPQGLPLYQKCGFEEYRQHDIVIDLARWGHEHVHRHVIMVRWPKDLDRLPDAWRKWKEAQGAK